MAPVIRGIGTVVYENGPEAFDRRLGLIDDVGFDVAEITVAALGVIAGGRLVPARLRAIERAAARRGLGYTVHAPLALNFLDGDNADLHRAVGHACLEFCAALGARVLVVHPSWVAPSVLADDHDGALARERAGLTEMAESAVRHGVTLCLENMPVIGETVRGELVNHGIDPASVAAQVETVGHPNLAATIDVSHAFIAATHAGTELRATLEPLAPWTRHLHVHDSFGRVPSLERIGALEAMAYGQGDLHLPLGWGTIDWDAALTGLPIRPDTVMTLEIFGAFSDAETLADSLARARGLAGRMEGT